MHKICFILFMVFNYFNPGLGDSLESSSNRSVCFPKSFRFATSTSAYQVEGAWNISGKRPNIWDTLTHKVPSPIDDGSTGDVAADSYHLYNDDVRLLKNLRVHVYRFSISWARVLPYGSANYINKEGIDYYNNLINLLLKNSIEPMVTMYHWDLPQVLQDLGGWPNPIIANYFLDYSKVLFDNFADRVKLWITINEPFSVCEGGYAGFMAPDLNLMGFGEYLCGHTILKAHALAYRLYERSYKDKYRGKISIAISASWLGALSNTAENIAAAERAMTFTAAWFGDPIYSKQGDYPKLMRNRIDNISKAQGFYRSRLPYFTKAEINMIRGTYDFFGLNHYTTNLIWSDEREGPPNFYSDAGIMTTVDPDWRKSNSSWLRVVPLGFRKVLNWISTRYNKVPIYVVENGISTKPGLNDEDRIYYIDRYLRALHDAIDDGCDVKLYTYWSLIDNFEWLRGFSERFGLHEVDFSSPNKTRTPRRSAKYFKDVILSGCLPIKPPLPPPLPVENTNSNASFFSKNY